MTTKKPINNKHSQLMKSEDVESIVRQFKVQKPKPTIEEDREAGTVVISTPKSILFRGLEKGPGVYLVMYNSKVIEPGVV